MSKRTTTDKKRKPPSINELKKMSDEDIVDILTKYGKQFCPMLLFVSTEQSGVFRLTDEKWSWSILLTLDEMRTSENSEPFEWIKHNFIHFNDYYKNMHNDISEVHDLFQKKNL